MEIGTVVKFQSRYGFVVRVDGQQARVRFTNETIWVNLSELEVK
jgi:hypothetical protein